MVTTTTARPSVLEVGPCSVLRDFDGELYLLATAAALITHCRFRRGSQVLLGPHAIVDSSLFEAGSRVDGGDLRNCFFVAGARLNGQVVGRDRVI